MAEEEASTRSKITGWLKGGFTAIFGIVWGAVLMYLSPLVNNAIKPAKPVANFSVDQSQGPQVTFHNLTLGATDGWWDFGDGSALEPFSPHQATLPHAYTKPGAYSAKLTVHNLIGDESERTVNVQIDAPGSGGTTSASTATEITALQALAMKPDPYAPATFRIVGKVANADLAVWAFDERPLHLVPDPPPSQERYLTFKEPGKHVIRLAVVRGKQVAEKSVVVEVEAPPAGMAAAALAVLNVTYDAAQVETRNVVRNVAIEFPTDLGSTPQPFQKEVVPDAGFKFIRGALTQAIQHPGVKDVKLGLTPDGKVVLSCEMVKVARSANHSAHRAVAELALTEQRSGALTHQAAEPVVATLNLPGSTVVQMPPPPHGWEVKSLSANFDLLEGQKPVHQHITIPLPPSPVMLQNRQWTLSATEIANNQVRIDVIGGGQSQAAAPAGPVPPGQRQVGVPLTGN